MSAAQHAHAERGCLYPEVSLQQAEIDSFLAAPEALLNRYPAGGPPLSARVQRLAASDTRVVPALIALAKHAESAHVVAIGIGLGRAAGNCAKKRPDLAGAITRLVVSDAPPSLRALFSSEATVAELAIGAPSVIGQQPAPGVPDHAGGEAPLDTATPSLQATLEARPPGFLLPAAAGAPPAQPSRPALVGPPVREAYQGEAYQGPYHGPYLEPSAAVALAPLLGELESNEGAVEGEGFATFFTAAGPGDADELPPASGDKFGALGVLATEGARDARALRRALFSAPEDDIPSFGTGGLVAASSSVISPTR